MSEFNGVGPSDALIPAVVAAAAAVVVDAGAFEVVLFVDLLLMDKDMFAMVVAGGLARTTSLPPLLLPLPLLLLLLLLLTRVDLDVCGGGSGGGSGGGGGGKAPNSDTAPFNDLIHLSLNNGEGARRTNQAP